VARRRQAWFDGQPDLDPERLIFVDESAATTNMARLRGRAPRRERCRAGVPHGPWTTTTFVGALRLSGMTAPMVLDGPMKGPAFLADGQQGLAPTLKRGQTVIMDTLPAHKVAGVQAAIEAPAAARQPRLQPDRARLCQEGRPAPCGSPDHPRAVDHHRQRFAAVHPSRVR
jgi:transposase